ncbi:MAG: type II toxin-antitoxin system HicA family toxin [Lachnospiraceae bacterium]|nr:type II toxin-antitoxin system HicA family toxin [Lachnospiraceae bacterium]
MGKYNRILIEVLSGQKDNNINFNDLCNLLEKLGGDCRIRGDHHIFSFKNLPDNINIQPKGNKAKAYQIKQIRQFLTYNKIGLGDEDV